jgi:CubicO group peptidase (beta-lactamase class C family)
VRYLSAAASTALVACSLLPAGAPASPTPRPPLTSAQIGAIDTFVQSEMARTHVPGAAVGVFSRGQILLAKGYGLANVELDVPVKPETIFQSGSVGKQFVATAIMMLVEQGRVSLDDSITKYFPGAPASWRPIRVKNLLSHTSGLAEYETPERTGPNGPFYLRLDFTEDQLLHKIEALPVENPPGAKWAYRNTNYVLLGFLIHKVTGKFYADYLAEHIFKPLGMTSTRLISDSDIIMNRASGYQWDGKLQNQDWVSPTFNSTADGTLYFNVPDLARWDNALYSTQLLTQASLNRMWTVFPLDDGRPNPAHYGFGWFIAQQNGHRRISHGGAWQGFTCDISRYPDDSLAVVVLTNLDAVHARPGYMAQVIAGLADPPLLPPRLTAIPDRDPEVAASLVKLLSAIASGASTNAMVTPDLQNALTSAGPSLRKDVALYWPGTLTLVQRIPDPDEPGLIESEYRIVKGANSHLVWFELNRRGKANGLFMQPDEDYRTVDT